MGEDENYSEFGWTSVIAFILKVDKNLNHQYFLSETGSTTGTGPYNHEVADIIFLTNDIISLSRINMAGQYRMHLRRFNKVTPSPSIAINQLYFSYMNDLFEARLAINQA